MEDETPKFKAHLFVCTNGPDRKGKCGHKGAEALRQMVKERCHKEGYGKDIRINGAGCLGQCERGIAAVMYPQHEWFLDLDQNDDDKLFKAVKTAMETSK